MTTNVINIHIHTLLKDKDGYSYLVLGLVVTNGGCTITSIRPATREIARGDTTLRSVSESYVIVPFSVADVGFWSIVFQYAHFCDLSIID